MKIVLTVLGYLRWHYGKAIYSLSNIWVNFLYLIFEYFSIKLLFENYFSPWKRMTDNYPKKINLKEYFYTFTTNLIMRIVGLIMRSLLIIIGLICYVLLALLYPLAVIIWLILPIVIFILIIQGFLIILK